jgi:enoyl-CoA hydratase/carnithine racemase
MRAFGPRPNRCWSGSAKVLILGSIRCRPRSLVTILGFCSANPDFFIAHLDVAKAAERPEVLDLWRDFVLRLSSMPVVSIAKIRGRTRGIGNEFVLACDMRFASRQSAQFGNPEVGVGLVGRRSAGMAPAFGRPLART